MKKTLLKFHTNLPKLTYGKFKYFPRVLPLVPPFKGRDEGKWGEREETTSNSTNISKYFQISQMRICRPIESAIFLQ